MTHNIQIGVNIDDESIMRGIEESVIKNIQKGLFGRIIGENRWGEIRFSRSFVDDVLNKHIEKIFADPEFRQMVAQYTASELADRLMRSNKFKGDIAGLVGGKNEGEGRGNNGNLSGNHHDGTCTYTGHKGDTELHSAS